MSEKTAQDTISEQGEVLQAFSRTLDREAHTLTWHPDLLWQQLYNRLQWEKGPAADLVAAEREESSKLGRKPWIRARTPFRESKALIRTLTGHTKKVNACAISPDGKWIVSASGDQTLKIWDAASGRELRTLSGHTSFVRACAFSPDGQWIVSASVDQTLKVWDAASGKESFCIPLLGEITAVDLHRWKPSTACGDTGGNIYLLDLVGITYTPINVTAQQFGQGLVFRCPACQKEHPIEKEQLGAEMTCPTPGCGLRLKLNPFVIRRD